MDQDNPQPNSDPVDNAALHEEAERTKSDRQTLACRCIANLIEAFPPATRTAVNLDTVGTLVPKLLEIDSIDLAEQVLQTLAKISVEHPLSIVQKGGLMAMLQNLNFFNIHDQRTALTTVANCCRKLQEDHFDLVRPTVPLLAQSINNPDRRLQESACHSVVRIIESYHAFPNLLAELVTADLCSALQLVLVPPTASASGGDLSTADSPVPVAAVPDAMVTDLVRALSLAAKASPLVARHLLLSDASQVLYAILTGSRAPTQMADASVLEGTSSTVDKMTLLQNLSARPKEQIEAALSLASQLLPSLPTAGVFDPQNYSLHALQHTRNHQAKQNGSGRKSRTSGSKASKDLNTIKAAPARLEDTEQAPALHLCQLLLPVLVEIHTASVTPSVRHRAISAILQILAWGDSDQLYQLLVPVPMSTFLAGVLSSNDGPSIVLGSLQIVELLMVKVGHVYQQHLEREGVLFEIHQLASKELSGEPLFNLGERRSVRASTRSATARRSSSAGKFDSPPTLAQQTDLNILRAQMIEVLYTLAGSESVDKPSTFLGKAKTLAERLQSTALASTEAAQAVLDEVLDAFSPGPEGLAGWELLQSGLVSALLVFAGEEFTTQADWLPVASRRDTLHQALASKPSNAVRLVQRLQENVSRVENVELASLNTSLDDDMRRSSGLTLTNQMRLNLIAGDNSQVPQGVRSMVIGLHAIAPFATVNEFMRAKVRAAQSMETHGHSNTGLSSIDRTRSLLAALSASAGMFNRPASRRQSGRNDQSQSGPEDNAGTTTDVNSEERDASATNNNPDANAESGHGADANAATSADAPAEADREARRAHSRQAFESAVAGGSFDESHLDEDMEESHLVGEDDPDGDGLFLESEPAQVDETDEISPLDPSISTKGADKDPKSSTVGQETGSSSVAATSSSEVAIPSKRKRAKEEWYLAYSVGGRDVGVDETVFGAVYQMHKEKDPSWAPDHSFWTTTFPVEFRKIKGPAPSPTSSTAMEAAPPKKTPVTLQPQMEQALKLLHVLYDAMTLQPPHSLDAHELASLFVNNKLTAKLNRQMEEPLLAASQVLPQWAQELPRLYPFLFPFATRFAVLQSTAFGPTRLVARWQSLLRSASGGDTSMASRAREEAFGFLGRLSRQKVRIGRDRLLESIIKICASYAHANTVLEVEYFDEVGTGLGPTLEFYSMASFAFARKGSGMWLGLQGPSEEASEYVSAPQGLFPLPLRPDQALKPEGEKRIELFRTLGTFVAKSLLDSRIIHITLNPVFWALVVQRDVPKTVQTIGQIDSELASSLTKVLEMPGEQVEHVGLDFTFPGDDSFELVEGGKDRTVTASNVSEYIALVADALVGQGAAPLVDAFRQGFHKMMDPDALASFMPSELMDVFGNAPEDWSLATLGSHIKPDHGFTSESEAYQNLLSLMASFDQSDRRAFLQWLTGSPKLPIGGFKALQPPLTVVKRPHEAPLTPNDYLPSVMTCVNYLKLPNYSSVEVLGQRVRTAMHEGGASFHLS